MKTAEKKLKGFQIAATYIGITIGAGFASGQEVLQYFSLFGLNSFPALVLASALFIFFGWLVLNLGARLQARTHREILDYTSGKFLGTAVDAVITFFLFGSFVAMLAGTGASLQQQFNLPPMAGVLGMATLASATVLFGLAGIVSTLSFLVPVMMVGIVALSLAVLIYSPPGINMINIFTQPWAAVIPYWPLSALTYVSYNLVVAVAILAPMGRISENRVQRWEGALFGGIGLGAGILAINLSILGMPESFGYSIPMNFIASRFSPTVALGYTAVLLAAIYTTAVGGLYGFTARITSPESRKFKLIIPLITTVAIAASQLGFTNLVRFLYSGVGLAGFLLLGGLGYSFYKTRIRPKPNPAT